MSTGHWLTHAPHDVQDHSTSGSITPYIDSSPISGRSSSLTAPAGAPPVSPAIIAGAAAMAWSRRSMIRSLGDSGFSVFQAGHCDWQRPHSVQVVKSSSPFHVKSWIDPTPSLASSSRSSMSSRVTGLPAEVSGLTAPSAIGRRPKSTLSGATKIWRCLELSTKIRNASITPMWSRRPRPSRNSSALWESPSPSAPSRLPTPMEMNAPLS